MELLSGSTHPFRYLFIVTLNLNRQIDLMILYTEGAKESLGGISDAQMETALAAAITSTNEAMTNSDIDLEISVVYVGTVRF